MKSLLLNFSDVFTNACCCKVGICISNVRLLKHLFWNSEMLFSLWDYTVKELLKK